MAEANSLTSPTPVLRILGIPVSQVDLPEAVARVRAWVARGERHYVCVREVSGLIDATHDRVLAEIHERAGLVVPDGMPLVWVSRWRGSRTIARVCGRELMQAVMAVPGLRHFLYGGAPGVAERLSATLQAQAQARGARIEIVGMHCPPFRELSAEEEQAVLEQINRSGADCVWVGISSPRQDLWMAKHRAALRPAALFGVGAAFDFLAGTRRIAPRWMQRAGLEWLFRLGTEPRRLWRRYLINGPEFVLRVLAEGSQGSSPTVAKGVAKK